MGYEMGKIEARMTEARVENGVKITFGWSSNLLINYTQLPKHQTQWFTQNSAKDQTLFQKIALNFPLQK